VVARYWSARTTAENAPRYADHLRQHVVPVLRGLDGYAGARLLQRTSGSGVEVVVLTWWQSLDAIRAFAGADLETAVVADAAAALLTDYDRRVNHYEVMLQDAPDT
jgi:heme-degrading monooxygenase HmoA